ncbi:MAG: hypothetical protein ABW110_12765 [Steroidobacteraceae bacterium]
MNDKLAKLGYRLRKVATGSSERPGDVGFDDRGNAVYQWKHSALEHDSAEAERLREQALEHPGLAIVDDEPRPEAMIQANPKGLRVGYNPYESGMLDKKGRKPKTDLRELSRWIEMKKKMEAGKKDSD